MSDFEYEEAYPIFPIFLLVDVSGSMKGPPIEAVNSQLPSLKQAVKDDPTVGEIARLGLMSFGSGARTELPLCDLQFADLPILSANGTQTDFGAAFTLARSQIEAEIRSLGRGTRFHRPVVFFLSDGHYNATGDWRPAYRALTSSEWKFRPEIVAFGFGEANQEEIRSIATRHAFFANETDPAAAVREIMQTIIGSIKVTSHSLHGGSDGGLDVPVDQNRYTILPVQTVD